MQCSVKTWVFCKKIVAVKCFLPGILPPREFREMQMQTNSTDQAMVYLPFCQWLCLSFRKMWWIVCPWRELWALREKKRGHIACLIPGLQTWNESHCCFEEIPFLWGKTRKRTAEGTISFCEKNGCKVMSKLGIIWDTHGLPFYFGVSRLLRESLSTLKEQ